MVLSEEPVPLVSVHGEMARRYAKLAQRLVENVGDEVREVEEGVSPSRGLGRGWS